jgi:hypothetical protein
VSLESGTRFTFDITAIPLVKRLSHLPVIGDPSHATGKWYLVEPVAIAALGAGSDGLIIEVHPDPDHALSDGPQSLTPANFTALMQRVPHSHWLWEAPYIRIRFLNMVDTQADFRYPADLCRVGGKSLSVVSLGAGPCKLSTGR